VTVARLGGFPSCVSPRDLSDAQGLWDDRWRQGGAETRDPRPGGQVIALSVGLIRQTCHDEAAASDVYPYYDADVVASCRDSYKIQVVGRPVQPNDHQVTFRATPCTRLMLASQLTGRVEELVQTILRVEIVDAQSSHPCT